MLKILEYQNTFSSDLSSFKYNKYCNGISFLLIIVIYHFDSKMEHHRPY